MCQNLAYIFFKDWAMKFNGMKKLVTWRKAVQKGNLVYLVMRNCLHCAWDGSCMSAVMIVLSFLPLLRWGAFLLYMSLAKRQIMWAILFFFFLSFSYCQSFSLICSRNSTVFLEMKKIMRKNKLETRVMEITRSEFWEA